MTNQDTDKSSIFYNLSQGLDVDDATFDTIYPVSIQNLSDRHWTPVEVAKKAAEFLVGKNQGIKVLDIGSGCGKFCLIGAALTKGQFYGVEQRENLVDISRSVAGKYNILNTSFIHTNIAAISFAEYDAFYFYNPFFENINSSSIIDHTVLRSKALFFQYSKYVHDQLSKAPVGTRLATFWSICNEVPESYEVESLAAGKLVFWKKVRK